EDRRHPGVKEGRMADDVPAHLAAAKLPAVPMRLTWVRWRIVALLMAFSCLSWFLRVSISVAYDERIHDQLGISPPAMGYVFSAFLFAYALSMTPGGWFIDRFGARVALAAMGFGLAVFGALTGAVGPVVLGRGLSAAGLALVLFLVVRTLMGICAAPMYPASAHAIARWLPLGRRCWANGLVQGSACVGIAATPLVFGNLIDWLGWPLAFQVLAAVTVLLALVWALYATDRPAQHRGVGSAERALIEAEEPPAEEGPAGSWLGLLRNRSLVCLTLSYAAVGYFEYLFFFWIDFYFKDRLQLPDEVRRVYAGIPILAMAVGMALGGWVSDRLVRAYGYRLGRALVPSVGMLAGAGFLLLGIAARQPEWVVVWFSLALGMAGSAEAPVWTTALELGGRRGGTAAGICNTGGNLGGIVSPVLTPLVGSWSWPCAIALGSVVCVLGAGLWIWIDPRERCKG
ncbi:MAG TPA: MFS transporter, partial [Gemmataceae bacterium]|nr:MFS transporter [Gemmataceae bacterium]